MPCPYMNPGRYRCGGPLVQGMLVALSAEVNRTHEELVERILHAGLAYSDGVDPETSLVICNERAPEQGKGYLARELGAAAIIAPTLSGRTARILARYRPTARIIAPAPTAPVLRRMALTWGLRPVPMAPLSPADVLRQLQWRYAVKRFDSSRRIPDDAWAVLEHALASGEESVKRGPDLLAVLRDAGVVDAGGYGLTIIFAGVIAALRGADPPPLEHHAPARVTHPQHISSTYRFCTNFAVEGTELDPSDWILPLEALEPHDRYYQQQQDEDRAVAGVVADHPHVAEAVAEQQEAEHAQRHALDVALRPVLWDGDDRDQGQDH